MEISLDLLWGLSKSFEKRALSNESLWFADQKIRRLLMLHPRQRVTIKLSTLVESCLQRISPYGHKLGLDFLNIGNGATVPCWQRLQKTAPSLAEESGF
ncbi:hypothetical protein MAF45_03940 [Mesosutterella sp. OilRF-GAM-744-9]|uniref:Uncharacterized protein n=1 Tax=Mesosutterella porci TaxID=2915351 RepID=A0ABS9MPR4_9BURK|nr:hypothetical protein [Mesosutterella sp. oilRF-744-WT-GAM-9]